MAEPHALTEFTPILQNVYLPIRKNLWSKTSVLAGHARKIGPETVTFAGHDLIFDVKVGRRGGFVASSQGYAPESLVAREKQGRLGIARNYAKLYVDGFALKATQGKRGAYITVAKKLMEDLMDQWKMEQSRVMHGDGLATRALVKSRTSATVVVVDAPYGISGAGPGNLHIEIGDTLASHDASASNALLAKAKVTDISLSGDDATITFDASIEGSGTIAAGDLLVTAVPASVHATDSSYGAEPYGLKAFVDVENSFATFEGINDSRWVAQKTTSSTVDEMIVQRFLMTIKSRSGVDWQSNAKSMLLLTTPGIWLQYGESLLGLRRYSAPEMKLNGGFTGIACAGSVIYADEWAPRGRLYAIHGPDTIFVDLMDFGAVSYEDSGEWQRAANRDGFEKLMAIYWNYGVTARNSHGVISGITDSTNLSPVY